METPETRSLLPLFTSGLFVVFSFAVEFGRRHGNVAYGFAPPLLIVYAFYLLGAFIAGNSLRGKIRRDSFSVMEFIFLLYLIVAAGTWMLSHDLIFSFSLLVIGLSSAIGFTAKYFHLVYPSILLFDAIVILNHNPLILTLSLCSLTLYFLFLLSWKHEVKNHDDTPNTRTEMV